MINPPDFWEGFLFNNNYESDLNHFFSNLWSKIWFSRNITQIIKKDIYY